MAAERYLSRRIPDLRVGNNIDEIDKKLIPASIHPCSIVVYLLFYAPPIVSGVSELVFVLECITLTFLVL